MIKKPFLSVFTLAIILTIVGCGGGGSSSPLISNPTPTPVSATSPSPDPTVSPSPGSSVTISGSLSYDFVPHLSNGALDYNNISIEPIRGTVVQLLNSTGAVIDTTVSDELGAYSLNGLANTNYRIRVVAELRRATQPQWAIRIQDNTDANAQYVLDGQLANSGPSGDTRNLRASSGWTGSDYTQPRAAAPFAILDSVYQLLDVLVNDGFNTNLPTTELFWSINNRANAGNRADGNISTSFYDPNEQAMYILGDKNNDTDEYDRSVIQHEFTHFLEDVLSRSDSIGGSHSARDQLDMRVAFSEGFANGVTAFASGSGIYEDSGGLSQGGGFRFSLEQITSNRGWFSEGSVGNIILDIADDTSEFDDNLNLGLGNVFRAIQLPTYINSSALTSVYLFLEQMRILSDTATDTAINELAQTHDIFGLGIYGAGETTSGGVSEALPVYHTLNIGSTVNVCSNGDDTRFYNALDVRRFIRFTTNLPRSYSILIETTFQGTGEKDPDAILHRNGIPIAIMDSGVVNREQRTMTLGAGEHILEVYDFNNAQADRTGGTACFDVTITEGS